MVCVHIPALVVWLGVGGTAEGSFGIALSSCAGAAVATSRCPGGSLVVLLGCKTLLRVGEPLV